MDANMSMDDKVIMGIKSPKDRIKGVHAIVYKCVENHWAIVALTYKPDNNHKPEPQLGIRWFYGKNGYPAAGKYKTWFIVPRELREVILDSLKILYSLKPHDRPKIKNNAFREKIDDFLAGDVSGKELYKFWEEEVCGQK